MNKIATAERLTEMAKALFKEERARKRLDGWFLSKEIRIAHEAECKDEPAAVQAAYLLKKVCEELPLSISENAIFAGTQRDAFARSYALINPSFRVESFAGYCDPIAVLGDIEPNEEITKERIDAVRAHDANGAYAEALSTTYAKSEQYTAEVAYFMEQVTESKFSPAIYYDGNEPKEFSSLLLTHFSNYQVKSYDSISEVIRTYYSSRDLITRIRQKSSDLRRVVQTALERNRKKYDLQLKQLRDTENRDKYKVYGELIHTYGYNLEDGAKELEALNYYTNEMIKIPLDPQKTPQENAKKYFDRYNKQKRTFEALSELIKETKDEIDYLESVSKSLDIARSEDDLVQIKEELIESGFIRRKQSAKKVKITSKPFHYISSDGFHMYVGKNNLQNEELTFHFANGGDWWFHAKKAPGSHVIVKTNGEELPDRTFEEAARLAAHYSKNSGAEKVEVDYVEKKQVKKPNGSKPGFVVYYTNYSMMIDSDISGIQEVQ